MECKTKMNTKKINQTVCMAGLAALVAVSAGCRANKLSLLSDRNIIPPPYKSPQLTQNAPAATNREMPAIAITPPVIPSDNEQPVLPGDTSPVFVQATPQDAAAQPHFDTPEDLSPKTGNAAKAGNSPKDAAPGKPAQPKRTYTVVKGDTLSDIAYMYMISWRDLAAENNLTEKSVLKVNQKLTLPPNAAKTPRPRQHHKAAPKAAPKSTAPAAAPHAATPKQPLPADGIYTVVANDNLWDIAKRFGLKSDDIRAANPNVDLEHLQINQKIKLPTGGKPASTATAAKPADAKATKQADNAPVPPAPPAPPAPIAPPAAPAEPAQAMPLPPMPAVVQPAAPQQPVPDVPTMPEVPALPPAAPITPQLNPPVPAN